jgi:hypothetical protein
MKTNFEFKIDADTISEARVLASDAIAKYLELPESENPLSTVDLETKVSISGEEDTKFFVVTVYARVKSSSVAKFGQ